MAHATEIARTCWTAADLVERFGAIPLNRIRHQPEPGTAIEDDVIEIHNREDRLYELVEGVLVAKAMGGYESYLATFIIQLLGPHVRGHRLGILMGADGMMRLAPALIRIPDVSFISFGRLPNRKVPRMPVADLAPDLAVEVISAGNTRKEMDEKLREYFAAGVRMVWYVYPVPREVHVFSSPDHRCVLTEASTLGGGDVLPGFRLALNELFAEPDELV